ncbi:nucleotidyl transferase AbiEii/AbiGii toxin family protein [Candidatus Daviesbacteria bacterium]|nr:nucleotidyl transferase AbiEii/AbiGii toxin family protein [Candidatus Daviesbacteria bacterium]
MGKISILTQNQQIILNQLSLSEYLKEFYLTGGTALSAFYLKHRYSDDLDFFSERKFDNKIIFTLMEMWSKKCNFKFSSNFAEVNYMFNLIFDKNSELKVDFAYYPYKRIEKRDIINGVEVDSLTDIAVNKLLVVTQRSEVKDFVDLYFLLRDFSVWDLIEGVKVKFKKEIDPFILAADFLKIEDFDFLPRMIKPLEIDLLKEFYRKLSKELGVKSLQ